MPSELLVAAAVATVAALIDLRRRRIPNWLTFGALLLGIVTWSVQQGLNGLLTALGGALLGFAVLLPFYLIRAVGAGDVKLLAGLGAIVGPQLLVSVILYGALVGGAISIVMLAQRGQLLSALGDIVSRPTQLRRSGAKAPYAVAMAGGTYLALVLPRVLS
jgi:prepilin peptidase CpaA